MKLWEFIVILFVILFSFTCMQGFVHIAQEGLKAQADIEHNIGSYFE